MNISAYVLSVVSQRSQSPYLVADGLSVVVDLLIKQLKQSRWVELEVLYIWLFGGSWRLQKQHLCNQQHNTDIEI